MSPQVLDKKIILLGITGGIAAYKSAELARLLVKDGCSVQVVMTASAEAFIAPLTFSALTGRPVYRSLFEYVTGGATVHIDLAREPHAAVVAPATANIIGKLASGIADDLLSTVLLAVDINKCPVVIAPSMNTSMLNNPAVRNNIEVLYRRGYLIADPLSGELACGEVGEGRMAEPQQLLEMVREIFKKEHDYSGVTVLVTAGPTREPWDPVRFLSNRSSGKMGYAIARAARERGAHVILVSGPAELEPPPGVEFYPVVSARQMYEAVMGRLSDAQVVIKAAAVSDYRPKEEQPQKIKKGGDLSLELVRNPDILENVGMQKGDRFLVGFAAETGNLLENARHKMLQKKLDMVVINNVNQEGAGFACETNIAQLLSRDGELESLPLMSKYELAHCILDRIAGMTAKK